MKVVNLTGFTVYIYIYRERERDEYVCKFKDLSKYVQQTI